MTNEERQQRLNRLAYDAPAQDRRDEPDTEFWAAVVNAWFLCDLIRLTNWDAHTNASVLHAASPIVWC